MSETPQGPGWWQASDGKWYPPHTHPNYRPAAGQPMMPPGSAPPGSVPPGSVPPGSLPVKSGGVPKGLIIAGIIVLVVVVAGFAAVTYVTGLVGDKIGGAIGGDCTLVGKGDVDSILNGDFELLQLGGITKIATPVLDSRVLADATTCWATENADQDSRLVRIARLQTSDAAARFTQELTLAKGVKDDRGGGITVESEPYFNKDVQAGDQAFCTTTDLAGSSGVLVRRGDTLIYVSLTSAGVPTVDTSAAEAGQIKFVDDDVHCDLAQKIAAKVG